MQSNNKQNYGNYPVKKYGKMTARDYQQKCIDAAIDHCKKSSTPAVLDVTVGGGKSFLIAAISAHVNSKGGSVLVLSRVGEICEQNAGDMWLCEVKNSLYSASLGVKSSTYPVILGTEGTVWRSIEQDIDFLNRKAEEPSKLINFKPALLLIDECHQVNFESEDSQYMKLIRAMQNRNPKLRIIGLTGTTYRGIDPIIGEQDGYFWKKRLAEVSTEELTKKGFLVPCVFGFGDDESSYDLSEFKSKGENGAGDYTQEELNKMEQLMLQAETTTEKIIIDVVNKAKNRNCVLITGSGKKHLQEAARFLPKGSYAIVTEEMPAMKRRKALKDAFDGKIKYLLNVGCLTVGVNIPLIDTVVILRKIGSLTLLVQLIGRGLRLLKDFQVEQGIKKDDCLVLDYSDTLDELKDLYDNPILEEATFSKSKKEHDLIQCPKCGEENSKFAVRCRGEHNGERCDYFWNSRLCEDFHVNGKLKQEGCKAENAPTARNCRICGNTLIDPNANLSRRHYTVNDYKPLTGFKMSPTKNNGVLVEYHMVKGEIAKVFYSPFSDNKIAKTIFYNKFVKMHCNTKHLKAVIRTCRNAGELCSHWKSFNTVEAITHRVNAKGEPVITKFLNKCNN